MENNIELGKKLLTATDFSIFGAILVVFVLIGVYFAFFSKRKENTTAEYLLANQEISVFPVAMSLAASTISSINFLSLPTEVYLYGSQVMLYFIPGIASVLFLGYFFTPVIWELRLINTYEYIKLRFNNVLSLLASTMFLTSSLVYTAVVSYAPSLALAQVSNFSLDILIPVFSVVCIFYTSLGGVRAVIWSDTLQMMLMVLGVLIFFIGGVYDLGGFGTIWERNENSGRIEFFNMDFDPRTRTTFWGITFGFFFAFVSSQFLNQGVLQRCLSLPSYEKTKQTLRWFAFGFASFLFINSFNGLILYAAFYDCDPLTTKEISKVDQLAPYYWMVLSNKLPFVPGILISALYSAAFSTISPNLNSMAGVFVIDFIKPFTKRPISDKESTIYMKIMVVVFGCLIIALTFAVDQMASIFQTALSFQAVTKGPILGIFILGLFFPWANSTGTLIGTIVSFVFLAWICIGTEIEISTGQIQYPTKPLVTDGCDNQTLSRYYSSLNGTKTYSTPDQSEPFQLYLVSYAYYNIIGAMVTTVVGLIASLLTGGNDYKSMDIRLFSPIIRRFIKCEDKISEKESNITESCHL